MSSDILLMFNGEKLYPYIQNNADYQNSFTECYLAECFWIAQFSLLVKDDHLIGITYWLNEEYFEHVSAWVRQWNSPYLQLKDTEKSNYYSEGYVTKYAVEIYFILDEPDQYKGLAMIEDRWWYVQDDLRDQQG